MRVRISAELSRLAFEYELAQKYVNRYLGGVLLNAADEEVGIYEELSQRGEEGRGDAVDYFVNVRNWYRDNGIEPPSFHKQSAEVVRGDVGNALTQLAELVPTDDNSHLIERNPNLAIDPKSDQGKELLASINFDDLQKYIEYMRYCGFNYLFSAIDPDGTINDGIYHNRSIVEEHGIVVEESCGHQRSSGIAEVGRRFCANADLGARVKAAKLGRIDPLLEIMYMDIQDRTR